MSIAFLKVRSGSGGVNDLESLATAAQTCTLYVGANGSTRNTGTTPSSPITLLQAASVAVAGDTVCIAPGTYSLTSTFYPAHSGNGNAWIIYTSYGTGVVNIVWTAGANAAEQRYVEEPQYFDLPRAERKSDIDRRLTS